MLTGQCCLIDVRSNRRGRHELGCKGPLDQERGRRTVEGVTIMVPFLD